jgi:hypothetical protein
VFVVLARPGRISLQGVYSCLQEKRASEMAAIAHIQIDLVAFAQQLVRSGEISPVQGILLQQTQRMAQRPPVASLPQKGERLFEPRLCLFQCSLVKGITGQVDERYRDIPRIPWLPEDRQTFFQLLPRSLMLTTSRGEVPWLPKGHGGPPGVANASADSQGFFGLGLCLCSGAPP